MEIIMGFFVPILMFVAFIFVWVGLTKTILALDRFFMRRSLMRSRRLDMKSTAALINLCFVGKTFFYSRWFPKRTPQGTLYEEIPCILVFGRKIFVLEVCSMPGTFRNTGDEFWLVTAPAGAAKKKEIRIKNPILVAQERASLLKDLLDKVGYASDITVESMVIFTDKEHKLVDPDQTGLYTVNKALSYLSRFAPKTKPARRRMKRENQAMFDIFGKYSLAEKQAVARNNKMRHKKQ